MATLLLGGARSSAPLMAGLFLSSIFTSVDGRGEAEGVVATGMRRRVREGRQGGWRADRDGQEEAKSTLGLVSSLDCARKRSCGRARRSARRRCRD